MNEAQAALSSLDEAPAPLPDGVKAFEFKDLFGAQPANEQASMDLLNDVQLDLKIELGRTQMHLEDVLRLKQGAVVTLDKLAGDPVDIYANGRLIARGEVLVLNDNFCVRVAELIAGDGRGLSAERCHLGSVVLAATVSCTRGCGSTHATRCARMQASGQRLCPGQNARAFL